MPAYRDIQIHPYIVDDDPYPNNEYWSAVSITWGELRDSGWIDWDSPDWSWSFFDQEQRSRVQKLIDGRFWFREIAVIPPGAWRIRFLQTLEEAMVETYPMYQVLRDHPDMVLVDDEFHKSRAVSSDFPATLLNGSGGDYASDGRDYEYETVHDGRTLDALRDLREFRHPDLIILDRLEGVFSNLVSLNVNAY